MGGIHLCVVLSFRQGLLSAAAVWVLLHGTSQLSSVIAMRNSSWLIRVGPPLPRPPREASRFGPSTRLSLPNSCRLPSPGILGKSFFVPFRLILFKLHQQAFGPGCRIRGFWRFVGKSHIFEPEDGCHRLHARALDRHLINLFPDSEPGC